MNTPFFRGRGTLAIVAGALLSLVFAMLLMVEGRSHPSTDTGRQDSYSYSAVGHRAFADLLRELDFAVTRSRAGFASRRQVVAAWVFAEPPRDELKARGVRELSQLIDDTGEVLLVLPKRVVASVDEAPDGGVAWVEREDASETGWLASEALDAALVRVPDVLHAATSGPARFDADDGTEFDVDVEDLQLIGGESVEPLVSNPDGILVGRLMEYSNSRVIVISDPDLISNHRLAHADNAAVAVWALRKLPSSSRLVMFDEVIHGHGFDPSLWRELTSFPLALALVQALIAAGFLVWAGASRFGAALPPEEQLGAGRRTLVANTAELLLRGGHATHSLERYFARSVETVADALHLPTEDSDREKLHHLSEVSVRLDRSDDPGRLAQEIDRLATTRRVGGRREQARRVLRVAHRIHRWREEMVHGPTSDPADR